MSTYTAAAEFVRRVRLFAERQPEWAECIVYFTKPDERWDLTLVSQRIYGTRDDFLAIMAAAGLDSVEQELREKRLVLPTARQLAELKTLTGFKTSRWDRTEAEVADPVAAR